jgi:Raf kinase inhibitor-like YbhB/YbcL family protein
MTLVLESTAFRHGGEIPARFTGTGQDVSPPLVWRGVPAGAKSLALMVEDPDATRRTFTHWLLWNLPTTLSGLAEGWDSGDVGRAGRNDFGRAAYGGPMPPPGHGPHRYVFRLYALDVPTLDLREGASCAEFERALQGHALATAELVGRFERRQDAAPHPR